MKHLKLYEEFTSHDDKVIYSIEEVDNGYRIFATTPVMRKEGKPAEDCETLFGKGLAWKTYLSYEQAQKTIDDLEEAELDEIEDDGDE